MCSLLTENGHDDDAKVEHVPRLFEVIQTQAEQFHDALEVAPPYVTPLDVTQFIGDGPVS